MALWVEVLCDENKQWPETHKDHFDLRCYSDNNNNPSGYSVKTARDEARRQRWKLQGNYAICPNCQLPN